MVNTRSQTKYNAKNASVEDYNAAITLFQLRKPLNFAQSNLKIPIPQNQSSYNLRSCANTPCVTAPSTPRYTTVPPEMNYSKWDDWDTINDPTWVPWNER